MRTAIYAARYGAGDPRVGTIVGPEGPQVTLVFVDTLCTDEGGEEIPETARERGPSRWTLRQRPSAAERRRHKFHKIDVIDAPSSGRTRMLPTTSVRARRVRMWAVTLGLLATATVAVRALVATGAPPGFVGGGVVFLAVLGVQSWRSGGRFVAQDQGGRPLSGRDPPVIRRALLEACQTAGEPVPAVSVVRMDVPGMTAGYSDGEAMVAVDPRLHLVVGPDGLRALFAHELGHFGTDIYTDAIREYLPQTVGFAAFWLVALAGRGPAIATAGSTLYVALSPIRTRHALGVRALLSLGVEPLALAASRYANRQEEYLADAHAADVVSPALITDALYHIAAIATGDNDEDVLGPVPWEADRGHLFALFATHPSIENRAAALDCDLPEWVRPYQPHRTGSQPSGSRSESESGSGSGSGPGSG
jgi:heat shock protein HtpX